MLRVRYVPRVISVTCLTSDSSLIQWSVSSTQFIWCVYVCVHVCKREVMERRGRGGREKELWYSLCVHPCVHVEGTGGLLCVLPFHPLSPS